MYDNDQDKDPLTNQPETNNSEPQETSATPTNDDYQSFIIPEEPTVTPSEENPIYHNSNPDYSHFEINRSNPNPTPEYKSTPVNPVPPTSSGAKSRKEKKGPTWGKIIALVLVCTVLGCGAGALIGTSIANSNNQISDTTLQDNTTPTTTDAPTETEDQTVSLPDDDTSWDTTDGTAAGTSDYTELYEQCNPACVAITVDGTTTNIYGQQSTYASAGSGFIVSSDGYIVTNNHVIEDADSISIMLYDGTSYDATLIGTDADYDIALLKIDATNLTYLEFGDSDDVVVGENVFAIGNPLGQLSNTLTTGIISALDRSINIDGTSMRLMQTNTAVSPGNSGCPLMDTNGKVIGVINSKSTSSYAEGIGFAIPANTVVKVINDLHDYGYVTGKPAFGVSINSRYDSTYASYYGTPEGVLIQSVVTDSAADKAGLEAGDIITKIGDSSISSSSDVTSVLLYYNAGDTATVTYYRDGEYYTTDVTFQEMNPDLEQAITDAATEAANSSSDSTETQDDSSSQQQIPSNNGNSDNGNSDSNNSDSNSFGQFYPWNNG